MPLLISCANLAVAGSDCFCHNKFKELLGQFQAHMKTVSHEVLFFVEQMTDAKELYNLLECVSSLLEGDVKSLPRI